jgi:hypothetical protein
MNIIQPSRKTRGCSWDGGECVFCNIDTGDCNLFGVIDWLKVRAAKDLGFCEANYTAEEMAEKLAIKVSHFDLKYKNIF